MPQEDDRDTESDIEEYIVRLWRALLHVETVGPLDDFFALGGSSMQMVQMLVSISARFQLRSDFDPFFITPQMGVLVRLVQRARAPQ